MPEGVGDDDVRTALRDALNWESRLADLEATASTDLEITLLRLAQALMVSQAAVAESIDHLSQHVERVERAVDHLNEHIDQLRDRS
jgi:ABC-type transporter Mla subunit MlaD